MDVAPTVLPRRPAGRTDIPLSVGQERLWFLDQLDPGDVAYNMFVVERLRGPLDPGALERALNEVVARHDSLRTYFPSRAGRPVQLVRPAVRVPLERVEVGGPAADRVRRAEQLVAARTNTPFDLTVGPLVRAALLRLAADDHVVCVQLHHIVADGWSIGVLRRELAEVYAAYRDGRPSPLEPLPIQYPDYAVWQRERLAGPALAEHLDYWRRRLAGAPALDLPTDRPRPPVKTTNGGYLSRFLPAPLWAAVSELARAERCTPYLMVLTAYQVLLARYSGQRDFCVGSPVAGRDLVELEPLIGYFVNTVVIRADLAGDPTFRELLRRARTTVLQAYAHQDVPFEELMVELDLERNLHRGPLFETLVNVYTDLPAFALSGVETEWFDAGLCRAKFDLTLEIFRAGPAARAGFTYNTDLFDPATIVRLGRDVERLLTAVAADPTARLSTLFASLVLTSGDVPTARPPGDRPAGDRPAGDRPAGDRPAGDQVLGLGDPARAGGRLDAAAPAAGTVLELVEAAVARDGTAVALVGHGGERLSYAELGRRVTRLASRLRAAGAGPGSLVAVCLPRSVDAMVALLAVWAAGAGYLPLDPDYPADRLAFMLTDSGAGLLLSAPELADRLASTDLPVLSPAEGAVAGGAVAGGAAAGGAAAGGAAAEPGAVAGGGAAGGAAAGSGVAGGAADPGAGGPGAGGFGDGRPPGARPGEVAYVIYTSGSTGTPKGVAVEHRALAARVAWMRAHYHLQPGDQVLQFAALSFDTFAEEVYPCLAAGATLVLGPAGGDSLEDFLAAGHGAELTVLDLPTSYWHELAARVDGIRWPPALRLLILGADQVDAAALARWWQVFGDRVRVLNTYGPTEATIVASAAELVGPGAAPPDPARRPPIGRAAAGSTLHVLDEWLNPVPVGVGGELYIGGAGVARGYLGRPGLTAERFVPDPFGPPGARRYRSGDQARLRADGQLEFLGRRDDQVKLRGYRVELGEIEAALTGHRQVRQAVAAVREDAPGDRRLVGYVVPTPGPAPTGEQLRRHLGRTLPEHMLPSRFVLLDRLPLTASGKLDRTALPAPDGRAASTQPYVPPRSPAEELAAEVWREVLGLARVGALDDFFALGGHSLLATRVVARLREQVGVEVPLRAFFTDSSLSGFAATLEQLLAAEIAELSDDEVARRLA